ncbi:hypothetical protein E4U23_006207 [Claviceps purpurea]|nr:hypothetical protein E4U23_006207 [Claviceps purpurea]
MPPAGTKVTTARSTPKSLPQMQSTISHDSATSGQPNLILPPVGQKTQESRTRTRTSFPPAEDAALLIYVESHTKDRTGYQIYKVFAESKLRSLGTPAPVPAPASVSVPIDSATTPAACPSSPQRKSSMSASATENPRQPSASHESTPAQSKEDETKIEDKENRDRFEYESRTFVEETRRSVSLYPEVEGQSFHLYKLARAVVTQKVANEQVDWRRVAEDLEDLLPLKAKKMEFGNESEADDEDHFYQDLEDFQDRSGLPEGNASNFGISAKPFSHTGSRMGKWTGGVLSVAGDLEAKYDWRQDQEVVDELKECFKENLAALFEEVLDDLEKEEAAQEHEEDEFQSNLDSLERQLYPSSPPVGPSGHKRPLDDDDDDDDDPVYLPEKSTKRRRLDRTAEIPSPPE